MASAAIRETPDPCEPGADVARRGMGTMPGIPVLPGTS